MSTAAHPGRGKNFESARAAELRRLETRLANAGGELRDAQIALTVCTGQAESGSGALAAAEGQKAAAMAANAKAQMAAELLSYSRKPAADARDQAVLIRQKVDPLVDGAHVAAVRFIAALHAIRRLDECVASRRSKNERVSPLVVNELAQLQSRSGTALGALLKALQSAMMACAMSRRATAAATDAVTSAARFHGVFAQEATSVAGDAAVEPASLVELANLVRDGAPGVLAVMRWRARIAQREVDERQDAVADMQLDLSQAQRRHNQAVLAERAAAAALTAARTAVA